MKKITVTIEGTSPLLENKMDEGSLLGLRSRKKKPKSMGGVEHTPREEAEAKVYKTPTGDPCIPAKYLISALIAAGVFVRLDGKRQISSSKSSIVGGVINVLDHYLPIEPGDWEVDIQQGRNPNGGEAVCLVRPRFDKWRITATVVFDNEVLSETQVRELFDIAVSRMGFGDFRPSRKGTFGRGIIVEWSVIEDNTR